jgi:Asp-tRNA(Asn)/Glu-tRNA(Gln) amidotransferase A subunit family amidase
LSFLKIGIYHTFFNDASPEVVHLCRAALEYLQTKGAQLVSIKIPELLEDQVGHLVTIISEAYANFDIDFYDAVLPDTKMILNIATQFTSRDYLVAAQQRTRSIQQLSDLFEKVNCIITPSTSITAPKIHPQAHLCGESNLHVTDELIKFMFLANYAGIPALTLPVGYDPESHLPIGLQIMTPWWREDLMLRIGNVLETYFQKERPRVFFQFKK